MLPAALLAVPGCSRSTRGRRRGHATRRASGACVALWRGADPALGTPADRYLIGRGSGVARRKRCGSGSIARTPRVGACPGCWPWWWTRRARHRRASDVSAARRQRQGGCDAREGVHRAGIGRCYPARSRRAGASNRRRHRIQRQRRAPAWLAGLGCDQCRQSRDRSGAALGGSQRHHRCRS